MARISLNKSFFLSIVVINLLLALLLFLFGYRWVTARATFAADLSWASIGVLLCVFAAYFAQVYMIMRHALQLFVYSDERDAPAKLIGRSAGILCMDAAAIVLCWVINLVSGRIAGHTTALPYLIAFGAYTVCWVGYVFMIARALRRAGIK